MNSFKRIYNFLSTFHIKEDKRIFTQPPKQLDESRIKADYSVTNKWHKGWKRPLTQIEEVVIHHTAGDGTWEGLRNWMLRGERKKFYVRGIALFHFAIGKTGILAKFGPIARWWYHSSSGQHDKVTVGVELIHRQGKFKQDQYDTLFWLLFEYMIYHCPNFNRIVSHDYNYNTYSNDRKGCPGPEFEWNRLENEMKKRGIQYTTSGFEEYELDVS